LKNILSNKISRDIVYGVILLFAAIGFFLTAAYFAVKWHVTNDPGAVAYNDRYFQEMKNKYNQSFALDSSTANRKEADIYNKILILSRYREKNASFIMNAYMKSKNIPETEKMLDAVDFYMKDNKEYTADLEKYHFFHDKTQPVTNNWSVFEWMNIAEWNDFKLAVAKDQPLIDSVAQLTGVEPRLLVSVLVGEQIRLFNSQREAYKKWIGPLKILSVETTFSLGVNGIKEETAKKIEKNLKDSTSVYYLGKKYEHMLDFTTADTSTERFKRLTSYKNHYYSYLYTALSLKEFNKQWERAGYPIGNRPEILATLFNIGFDLSKPKANPEVGGANIVIRDKTYTFGAIAYEFYYSGELYDLFPFMPAKFDWRTSRYSRAVTRIPHNS